MRLLKLRIGRIQFLNMLLDPLLLKVEVVLQHLPAALIVNTVYVVLLYLFKPSVTLFAELLKLLLYEAKSSLLLVQRCSGESELQDGGTDCAQDVGERSGGGNRGDSVELRNGGILRGVVAHDLLMGK